MENYNIYDEIGRGTHSFVYKARRKRSIEYVAVKSTAKSRMDKILNEVQLLHKLDSKHILKFYNWYESQNHIWLIFEFCIGGDLLNLITQDKMLPEQAVKTFGFELMSGLQYLHSNGILFCDLKPANILIDECGSLKLADFGLARRIPSKENDLNKPLAPGSPNYMAPELFNQPAIHSFASDFWALGCILYELSIGCQPFTHRNFPELARMIQSEELQYPLTGVQISSSFRSLLNRFFEKNPAKRITWDELIDHPFWEGLPKLQKISLPHQELFETLILSDRSPTKEINTRQSIKEESALTSGQDQEDIDSEDTASCETRSNKSSTEQIDYDEHEKEFDHNEQLISVKNKQELDMGIAQQKIVRPASAPVDVNSREVSTMKTLAEQLAPKGDCIVGKESNNEISENSEMLRLAAGSKKETYLPQTAPSRGTITISSARGSSSLAQGRPGLTKCSRRFGLRSASKLIYGSAFDCVVKPIVYSEDIELIAPLRVKMELLGFDGMSVHDLVRCKSDLLEGHLKKLYHALKSSNTTDASKLNLLAYLFGLSIHSKLANVIVNSSMFLLLVKMLKQSADDAASLTESQLHESSCQSLLSRVCLVLGVLIRFATFISPSSPTQIPAIVKLLSQVVNDHSSQTMMHQRQQQNDEEMDEMEDPAVRMRIRIRSRALSCLGELLFYLSSQKNWQFSSSGTAPGVQSILRSLDDRDEVARHYATRTICNLLLQCHDQDLLVHIVNEQVTLSLLNGFSRCCNSSNVSVALRTTTAQALSQVLRHASSGAIAIGSSSRVLQSNLMKLLCRQNFLELLWCGGVETGEQNDCSLAIACMNILNGFLDFNEDTTQGSLHFDQKKSQLLEKIAAFPAMLRILEKKSVYEDVTRHSSSISLNSITHGNKYSERSKKDSSTPLSEEANPGAKSSSNNVANVLRAKTLLFLYFGMQLSRSFAIQSISKQLLNSVEKILITYSSHLRSGSAGVERDDEDNEDPLEMTNTRLTSIDVYVLQCALNLIKLSIRTALKLSTDIVQEFHEENLPSGTQHISFDAPFKLYSLLLKNPMCKMQLIHFFVGNERKEYRFFVRIMAKLLLLRKSEAKNQTSPFALPVSDILLDLYDPKNNESGNTLDEDGGSSNSWNYSSLFNVEIESVLQYLLPSIMKQLDIAMVTSSASTVSEGSKGEDESIAVNCIRVMYSFLLHVGFTADTTVMISITDAGEEHNIDIASARVRFLTEHFFVRLPKLFHVEHPNENVWRFLVELLYGLVSHQERDEQSFIEACISSVSSSPKSPYPKNLLWSVIALLRTPSQENFHAFPSSVTKLVKLVVEHIFQIWSPTETLEKIFQCQMGKSIMSVLEFGHAQLLLTSCKVDLLEILYHVLYSRYEILKKANGLLVSPVGGDFDQLVQSAQFLLKLCSLSSSSIEDPTENEEVADLASRCLMFMGQIFGDQLNQVLFLNASSKMVLSSSTIDLWVVALEKGSHAVQLRMLLTLKNCIRCEKSSLSSRPLNVVSQLLHASSSRKFLKQIESCTNGSSSVNDSNSSSGSHQQMEDQIKKTAIEIRKLLTA